MYGKIVDCKVLNIRQNPSLNSKVLSILPVGTDVEIDSNDSGTDEFYKVYLASGVAGYAMKKFISVTAFNPEPEASVAFKEEPKKEDYQHTTVHNPLQYRRGEKNGRKHSE